MIPTFNLENLQLSHFAALLHQNHRNLQNHLRLSQRINDHFPFHVIPKLIFDCPNLVHLGFAMMASPIQIFLLIFHYCPL